MSAHLLKFRSFVESHTAEIKDILADEASKGVVRYGAKPLKDGSKRKLSPQQAFYQIAGELYNKDLEESCKRLAERQEGKKEGKKEAKKESKKKAKSPAGKKPRAPKKAKAEAME